MEYSVLSIKQPWATLLAHGRKTIEVRRWQTRFRGQLLIHAAGIPDERPEAWQHVPPELRESAGLRRGIVGVGVLSGCKVYRDRETFVADQAHHLNDPDWFEPAGLFGLCFIDLRPIPFREVKGYVRLFKVEFDDLEIPDEPGAISGEPGAIAPGGGALGGDASSFRGLSPPARLAGVRASPGLLVSVRSPVEAKAALAGGAAIIDVKEPDNGSLGRATPAVLAGVIAAVAGRRPVSAALGELLPGNVDLPAELASLAYVKWGLAGWRERASHEWQELLRRLRQQVESISPCRVVVVAYADWQRAAAPRPQDVLSFSARERPSVLLVDTWQKDGTTLLDWMSLGELQQMRRARGGRPACPGRLAGARRNRQAAVRRSGLVCSARRGLAGGQRGGEVEANRVRGLVEMINPSTSAG